jgi:hypothetical protein
LQFCTVTADARSQCPHIKAIPIAIGARRGNERESERQSYMAKFLVNKSDASRLGASAFVVRVRQFRPTAGADVPKPSDD